jgi:hypothetical protein
MTPEDEAFNEIEKRSKVKQTLIVHKSKEAMLTAEVAVLTEMVRVLSDKIAEMEKQNGVPVGVGGWLTTTSKQEQGENYERGFIDGMQEQMKRSVDKAVNALSHRTWVELSQDDIREIIIDLKDPIDLYKAIEAKLKEKNT